MSRIRCVTIVHLYCIFQKVANNEFTREANISFDSCASDWLTAKYFMWALIALRIGHVFSCLWLLCAVYGWWLVMARVGCWLMTDTRPGPWQTVSRLRCPAIPHTLTRTSPGSGHANVSQCFFQVGSRTGLSMTEGNRTKEKGCYLLMI